MPLTWRTLPSSVSSTGLIFLTVGQENTTSPDPLGHTLWRKRGSRTKTHSIHRGKSENTLGSSWYTIVTWNCSPYNVDLAWKIRSVCRSGWKSIATNLDLQVIVWEELLQERDHTHSVVVHLQGRPSNHVHSLCKCHALMTIPFPPPPPLSHSYSPPLLPLFDQQIIDCSTPQPNVARLSHRRIEVTRGQSTAYPRHRKLHVRCTGLPPHVEHRNH